LVAPLARTSPVAPFHFAGYDRRLAAIAFNGGCSVYSRYVRRNVPVVVSVCRKSAGCSCPDTSTYQTQPP
jgi:hypothetical protein